MDDGEHWTEQQLAAMRAILFNWCNLSRGDISIVIQCIRNPTAMALTMRGSPHADLWHELTNIGWAEQLYSPIDPYDHDPEPLSFRLTPGASLPFSYFLVFYDLLNMGACTPSDDTDGVEVCYRDARNAPSAQMPPSALRQPLRIKAFFTMLIWGFVLVLIGVAIGMATSF